MKLPELEIPPFRINKAARRKIWKVARDEGINEPILKFCLDKDGSFASHPDKPLRLCRTMEEIGGYDAAFFLRDHNVPFIIAVEGDIRTLMGKKLSFVEESNGQKAGFKLVDTWRWRSVEAIGEEWRLSDKLIETEAVFATVISGKYKN
ncbi:MAG TPA: hypothetical protein VHZ04_02735 [Candidatus Paceibacterota bacterium]|jgi:hypothetical protein|nr:hypothetical protein [Candidatus Paceibacterota bacterium]